MERTGAGGARRFVCRLAAGTAPVIEAAKCSHSAAQASVPLEGRLVQPSQTTRNFTPPSSTTSSLAKRVGVLDCNGRPLRRVPLVESRSSICKPASGSDVLRLLRLLLGGDVGASDAGRAWELGVADSSTTSPSPRRRTGMSLKHPSLYGTGSVRGWPRFVKLPTPRRGDDGGRKVATSHIPPGRCRKTPPAAAQ